MSRKILPRLALTLFLAQLLLVLVSWIWSAAMPMSGVHSLLSSEGIRWFLGRFAHVLATPLLVWILLLAMAWGCLHRCGLRRPQTYREHRALWFAVAFLAVYVGVVLLLTVMPHAVLLSALGTLWPSPFSASIVPVTAFGLLAASVVYGMVAGTFQSLADVYDSLIEGIRQSAPLLLFYILLTQFYYSFCFVLP